ncbi:MAG: helix-turn-helix domain-containing protein [Gallionella sp.]|nr:helix-turn-helix domain-containing protein [Gallionella sp.]
MNAIDGEDSVCYRLRMKIAQYLSESETAASLARKLGITPVLISQWRTGLRRVPIERCPDIEKATDGQVTCEELRPDIDWAYLRGTEKRAA